MYPPNQFTETRYHGVLLLRSNVKNIFQDDSAIQARKLYYESLNFTKQRQQYLNNLSRQDRAALERADSTSCCDGVVIVIYWNTNEFFFDENESNWNDD